MLTWTAAYVLADIADTSVDWPCNFTAAESRQLGLVGRNNERRDSRTLA